MNRGQTSEGGPLFRRSFVVPGDGEEVRLELTEPMWIRLTGAGGQARLEGPLRAWTSGKLEAGRYALEAFAQPPLGGLPSPSPSKGGQQQAGAPTSDVGHQAVRMSLRGSDPWPPPA